MKPINSSKNGMRPTPIKVFHITASTQLGGLERRLEMMEHSKDSRFSFDYITIGNDALLKTKIPRSKIRKYHSDKKVSSVFSLRQFLWVFSLLKSSKDYHVHAHGIRAIIHAIPASFLAGNNVRIAEFVGVENLSLKSRVSLYPVLFLATKVLAISKYAENFLKVNFSRIKKRVCYLNNPVSLRSAPGELAERAQESSADEVFRICYVGRLEPVKNPMLLLNVFLEFLEIYPNAELLIVGNGSLKSDLVERSISENVVHKVKFLGHVANPEKYIAKSNVYVQPSKYEAFGIAIVESMLLGIPPIVTKTTGTSYLINNGINGWVIDEPYGENLLNCLVQARRKGLTDLKVMGSKAKCQAQEEFSVDKYMDGLFQLYGS